MSDRLFTVSQMRPIREAMTVSRPAMPGSAVSTTWFSLGAGTSITPESYDCPVLYPGAAGSCRFVLGSEAHRATPS